MGGLVFVNFWIIDTLEQRQSKTLETLRHITFYATPHNGAPITTLANWNKQLKDMQLDSPLIEDIGNRWHEHVVAWKDSIPGPRIISIIAIFLISSLQVLLTASFLPIMLQLEGCH